LAAGAFDADDLSGTVPGTRPCPEAKMPAQPHDVVRRLVKLGGAICALLAAGTVGFVVTEDVDPWLGFVWSLDTVATIGSLPGPHDTPGEIVKVLLTLLGVGTLFYALVTTTELVVTGELGDLLAARRARRMTDRLSDHYIICGFGRVGRQVARDLRAANARYVVVDDDPTNREHVHGVGVRFILSNPSEDEALRDAGIARARAVVACVDSDAENIFITLTARELCPGITIVARAALSESESKLRRAGADRVVSPYKASGTEMARLVLHPNVTGAMDVAAEYRLEEIVVSPGSPGVGQAIGDVRGGALIVAIRHADGSFDPQPAAESVLGEADVVMALGTPQTLTRLERLFDAGDRAGS
jgi:voltage-gated potassium channel